MPFFRLYTRIMGLLIEMKRAHIPISLAADVFKMFTFLIDKIMRTV